MITDAHYPFENAPLPYAYDALEPYIDTKTMQVHHDIQAQAYVDNLNYLLSEDTALQHLPMGQLLINAQRMRVVTGRPLLRNAGGVLNHLLYFQSLQPADASSQPSGAFLQALISEYGDLASLYTRLKAVALSVFGSGYAWLIVDRNGKLGMIITVNQETPMLMELCPLLNIDLWEHAYYLKHYNDRSAYLDNLFHLINWDVVSARYDNCDIWDLSADNLTAEVQ